MEKIKYKSKYSIDFKEDEDFLEILLKNLGIKNIEEFLSPSFKNCFNPFLFKDIDKGLDLLYNVLSKDSPKIFIKVDPDCDGFTSSAFLVQFLRFIKKDVEISWKLNFEKQHGLYPEDLDKKNNFDLIIVPDASYENSLMGEIRKLSSAPILVLDHHKITYTPDENIVIINNQDGEYPNPTLSGVGVVYKFCMAYCQKYKISTNICIKMLDLVALGMIADNMDLTNLETRFYILEGLESVNNDFIKELADRCSEDMKFGYTITNAGWILAPRINACCRYGKPEEQKELFRAICGEQGDVEYQPRRKSKLDPIPEKETHTLQWDAARVCNNVKSRQDDEVRRFMEKLEEKVQKDSLDKNSILFVDSSDIIDKKTVTGLVANKLASKYMRPVLVLRDYTDEYYGGSGRNYSYSNIEDFNEWLTKFGVDCQGHEGAFGITLKKAELPDIIKKCNEALPLEQMETIYPVDYVIDAKAITKKDVENVAKNYKIWGGKEVPEPLFYIHDIFIKANEIQSFGSFIRFVYKGIPYVKKYCPRGTWEEMTCQTRNIIGSNTKNLVLNIIGTFNLEEYEGKLLPQIKIKYYDSNEIKKTKNEEEDIDDDFIF